MWFSKNISFYCLKCISGFLVFFVIFRGFFQSNSFVNWSIFISISYFATSQTKYGCFCPPGDYVFSIFQFIPLWAWGHFCDEACCAFGRQFGALFWLPSVLFWSPWAHRWPSLAPFLIFFSSNLCVSLNIEGGWPNGETHFWRKHPITPRVVHRCCCLLFVPHLRRKTVCSHPPLGLAICSEMKCSVVIPMPCLALSLLSDFGNELWTNLRACPKYITNVFAFLAYPRRLEATPTGNDGTRMPGTSTFRWILFLLVLMYEGGRVGECEGDACHAKDQVLSIKWNKTSNRI